MDDKKIWIIIALVPFVLLVAGLAVAFMQKKSIKNAVVEANTQQQESLSSNLDLNSEEKSIDNPEDFVITEEQAGIIADQKKEREAIILEREKELELLLKQEGERAKSDQSEKENKNSVEVEIRTQIDQNGEPFIPDPANSNN